METEIIRSLTDTFEGHAQQTEGGVEYWLGRDLQYLLGYTEWRNFTAVITKAKTACEVSGHPVADHFVDVNKTIQMPKSAEKEVSGACQALPDPCGVRQERVEKGLLLMSTLTRYQSLLLDYEPRPIRSEAAYRQALRHVEKLMRPRLSRDESELVEVLAILIEQYESREYPTSKSPPREMLAHLMEAHGVAQATVARATGIPRSTLSAVLTGRRKLSTANIAARSGCFHVSPSAFMDFPR